MAQFIRPLILASLIAAPWAALAEDATTEPAPAEPAATAAETAPADGGEAAAPAPGDLSMGQEVAATEPAMEDRGTFGDWTLRCMQVADGSDPCQIYQLLKDDKGTAVAEVTMVTLPEGEKAALGASIAVPLETLLTAGLQLTLDSNPAKAYPFTFCAPMGCFARIGFTADEFAAMKKGNKLMVAVAPIARPDQPVSVAISLKGFTDASEALKAEQAKAAPKQ